VNNTKNLGEVWYSGRVCSSCSISKLFKIWIADHKHIVQVHERTSMCVSFSQKQHKKGRKIYNKIQQHTY